MEGHKHWRLAAVVVSPPGERATQLAALVAERRWNDAAAIAEWVYDQDIREYQVVRCPSTGRFAMVTVVFTFELWSRSYREESRVLSAEDGAMLSELAASAWLPL